MGKSACYEKVGLKKGPWTSEEDQKLLTYIREHGHESWRSLTVKAGLQRSGKSCRLRWTNYLRPDIKRGKFSLQEEQTIVQLHALLGNRWATIATHLPKRTDNEIKNYWNTHLKKRLIKMGIDPVTHKPISDAIGFGQSNNTVNLNHVVQWESARVQAEARFVRTSKLAIMSNPYHLPVSLVAHSLIKTTVPVPPLKQPTAPPCLDILKAWQGEWAKPNAHLSSNLGSLDSPVSFLHFSGNMFTDPSIGSSEQSAFPTNLKVDNSEPQKVVITKENGQKHSRKCSEKIDDEVQGMLLHEIGSFPADAESSGLPILLEGFTDDHLSDHAEVVLNTSTGLYDNNFGSSCCTGDLEDNKKYWNAVL